MFWSQDVHLCIQKKKCFNLIKVYFYKSDKTVGQLVNSIITLSKVWGALALLHTFKSQIFGSG